MHAIGTERWDGMGWDKGVRYVEYVKYDRREAKNPPDIYTIAIKRTMPSASLV